MRKQFPHETCSALPTASRHYVNPGDRSAVGNPVRAGTHDDRPLLQGQQIFSILACVGNYHGGGEIWRTKANRGVGSGPRRWKQERGSAVRRGARKSARGPAAREQDALSYVGLFL